MGKQSRRNRAYNEVDHARSVANANKIAAILRKQGGFVRSIDGDSTNCKASNLAYCSLYDAFSNETWTVDWVCCLSPEQIDFVRSNMANFAYLFSE